MIVIRVLKGDIPGLGERIKQERMKDPRSLREIAKTAEMTAVNWNRIENETQNLPLVTLRKIEEVLGVDFGVEDDSLIDE